MWLVDYKEHRMQIMDSVKQENVLTNTNTNTNTNTKTDDNVAKVREIIRSNRRLTVRELAEEVSISKTVCHEKKT
jgi:response regulator of citrate/malate metabolism